MTKFKYSYLFLIMNVYYHIVDQSISLIYFINLILGMKYEIVGTQFRPYLKYFK